MFDGVSPAATVLLLLAYPIYILIMAGVLAICGVPRKDIAKWALRQAERQRLADLVRSLRGPRGPELPGGRNTPEAGGTAGADNTTQAGLET